MSVVNSSTRQPHRAIRLPPLCCATLIALLTQAAAAPAEPGFTLSATPNRCIALHEGQDCFLNATLTWNASVTGNYCLYLQQRDEPVRCWHGSTGGTTRFDFQSNKTLSISLREEGKSASLTSVMISVAWVYNAHSKKTDWRLF